MRQLTFSDADLQVIRELRYHHPEPRLLRQLDILWLRYLGFTQQQIAKVTLCSRRTVARTLTLYADHGLTAILHRPTTATAGGVLQPHRESLAARFEQEPPKSVKHAQQMIREQTGIHRGPTQVRRFLHSLDLKPRRVAAIPVPPKMTVAEHAARQNTFLTEQLEPRLAAARAGTRQVLFVDAAHFVFATFLGIIWSRTRRYVRAASGRQRFNVLGALDAVTHRLTTVCNGSYINAETVCNLLRALAQQATPGVPITLVLDNARYQQCALVRGLAAELSIELLFLPSYSPNLNLIERVWKFVKAECLRTQYYANYLLFREAITRCLTDLPTVHREAMDTLLSHHFQTFDDVPLLAA